MTSKGVDHSDPKIPHSGAVHGGGGVHSQVKLAPGWMSLGRKSRTTNPAAGAGAPVSPAESSTGALPAGSGSIAIPNTSSAPARVRISKAELLERYEPDAPPGLPTNMSSFSDITSVDALVPVNIAPDEDLTALMNAQTTSMRNIPRGSPSRSTSSISRHRLPPASPPAVNGRARIGTDVSDRNATSAELSSLSHNSFKSGAGGSSNPAFSAESIGNLASLTTQLSSSTHSLGVGGGGGNPDPLSRSFGSNLASGAGGTKRSASLASSREFWTNSSTSGERTGISSSGERKPLALKPRSAHLSLNDATGGGANSNGVSGDHSRSSQQGSNSYWTRSTSRGGADATANWRSGAGINGINSNGGGTIDSNHPAQTLSSSNLSSTVKNMSGSSHPSGASYSSRSGFGRETRDAFSRNKEALKPTNTRDLSALAKGSSRTSEGGSGSGSTHYNNRERDYRSATGPSSTEPKSVSKPVDILTDSRSIWYYKDPRAEVQGPFSAPKLMGWLKEGYFDETLALSRNPDSGFRPLAVVFNLGEKEAADVAPPGFVAESSAAHELSDTSSTGQKKNSDSRAQPERKMTVKEQQEEVEKQRLENRRKNVDKLRTTSDEGSNGGNGHTRVGVFGDELTDEGHVLEGKASELPSSKSSNAMFELATSGKSAPEKDHPGSSLCESRFASLMTASGVTADPIDGPTRQIPSESRLAAIQSLHPEAAKSQSTNNLLSHTSLPSGSPAKTEPTSSQPQPHPEPTPNAQPGWQSNAADPHVRAQAPAPAVSVGVSEHDLMALDPAIARATFSRRPAEASSSVVPESAAGHANWNESVTSPKPTATGAMLNSHAAPMQAVDRQALGRMPPVSAMPGLGTHNSSPSLSMIEAQAQALVRAQQASQVHQALSQAQAQAHHAQAQARARVQAEAQARVQAQAAHAHAQAQARARAAQLAAHAQVQNATTQNAAQNADPFWIFKHQLSQLQSGWEMHSRSRMEASQSLEVGRRHLANITPGSLEHRQAAAYCSNCDVRIQEHTLSMERIKAAAQNTQAQMQRHHQHQQQLLAQRQAQSQIPVQPPVLPNTQDTQQRLPDPRAQLPIQHPVTETEHLASEHEVEQLRVSVASMSMGLETNVSPPVQDTALPAATYPSPSSTTAENRTVIEGSEANISPAPVATTTDSFPSPKPVSPRDNEDSGWEMVERKPKVEASGSRVAQVMPDGRREAQLSAISLPSGNVNEPTRGPVDRHVLVASADKDPRKLEMAASTERELDEAEALRNKQVASIPAPWAKARQTGPKNLNLREIQRKEELESKAEMEKQAMLQAQREQAARLAAASRQSAAAAPWGSTASQQQRALSLREQMRLEEEQKQRAARQNAAVNNAAAVQRSSRAAAAQAQPRPAWSALVASNNVSTGPSRQASTVVGKRMEDDGTFWETVGHGSSRRGATGGSNNATRLVAPRAAVAPQVRTMNAGPRATRAVQATSVQPARTGMKKQEASTEPTNVQGRVSSEMAKWCSQQLRDITGNESNDKTFAEYLASLKSGTEIRDTVLQNLGSSDKTRAFGDEFIRRLAFEKSSESEDQGGSSGAGGVGGGRKRGRRQRGAKVVDPSLVLGFTSTSSSQRIMQGQIEKPTMD